MTPEQQRLADEKVEVVVLPNNRYGEAKAGERLVVTRAELASHGRCLAPAQEAPAARPRTVVLALPAEVARRHGLPLGRRQEGPIAFEVTRLPPDGKPQLPSRQELEARAQGGPPLRAEVRVLDMPEVKALLQKIRAELEAERERLRGEADKYVESKQKAHDEERAEMRRHYEAELAAAREEIAKLRAERQPPSAPPLPKGKKAE